MAFAKKGGIGLFEVDLSALMDELGFDALTSPTHSPVIGSENSSQSFFVSSTEFGMIFLKYFGCVMLPSSQKKMAASLTLNHEFLSSFIGFLPYFDFMMENSGGCHDES